MGLSDEFREREILTRRPEQISVQEFIALTAAITEDIATS